MTISLIHPSRGRPTKAKSTYDYWMAMASGGIAIEHVLSLDFSDPHNEDYGINSNGKYTPFGSNSKSIIYHNTCVVEATNQAAQVSTGGVLVYLSDDFSCPKDWDRIIGEHFIGITQPMVLKVSDGLQPFDNDVLTIPIMNRQLYQKLGYFWNPLYKSMFVDQDLYWVSKNNNWIKIFPGIQFKHEHYSVGEATFDETYRLSDSNWNSGKALYERRKAEGFKL